MIKTRSIMFAVARPAFLRNTRRCQQAGLWASTQCPRAAPSFHCVALRYASFEAGDNNSGHIQAGTNQSILFFDNVFPLRFTWRLPFLSERGEEYVDQIGAKSVAAFQPEELIHQAFPEESTIQIEKVFPRLNEGGTFVRLSYPPTIQGSSIEQKLQQYLESNPIKPWWSPFRQVRTRLVRGRPWVEDLHRLPSTKLKVEFENLHSDNPELTQEQLYSVFRPYGKLLEIRCQPSDSKELPKFAYILFAKARQAIMARNCLHGFKFEDDTTGKVLTKLMISYERKDRIKWVKDWIVNHPRIVIPILAALTAAITVAVFDPIRTFYIKTHITRAFHLTENPLFGWFISRAVKLLPFSLNHHKGAGMEAFEDNRKSDIDQLQRWLSESSDTFIVVQGPRGTGKKELVVDHALQSWKSKLIIDCKPIQESRGDSATINAMAQQVGYRPVFSWMNSLSGLVDLAAQSATGMKTGFSETLDTQIAKILNNTTLALKQISLDSRGKDDGGVSMDDDVYLEAHPERRPVVVIDNFLHKSQDGSIIYDKLAEWAAQVTTANIAHVIFLTTDVSFSKSLSRALPGRVFRQLVLGDASPEAAKRFVLSRLALHNPKTTDADCGGKTDISSESRQDLGELDRTISCLGGRLTDLEFLARRIKAGESPKKAIDEIIEQSASEILKIFLSRSDYDRKWSAEQAWVIIQKLADQDSVRYNEISLADSFNATNYEIVLQALEQAELISILSKNGRPCAVKPSKPVYGAAFRLLTQDVVLASRFRISILLSQIKNEAANIERFETELKLLGQLPKQPPELASRIHYLLSNIRLSQNKIDANEGTISALKKILSTEF